MLSEMRRDRLSLNFLAEFVVSWIEDRERVVENSKDVLEQLKDMQDVGVSGLSSWTRGWSMSYT
jgi:hypothetical protein